MRALIMLTFLWTISQDASSQDRTISGTVTSADDGSPLPGVNVSLKGANNGTVTDRNGMYRVEVLPTDGTLAFSYVGYTSVVEEIGNRSVIDVKLEFDATELNEVVVTGMGIPIEKRKASFAIESVHAHELPPVPTASIDQALIGKIPGALIMAGNGSPGSDVNIMLRGINSINRGTKPMYLVNGVEMGVTSLNSLDLNSIEKVEVVEGAAGASIYGAQGANGVIQIFTKQGKAGRVQVDFTSSLASNEPLNTGELAKANLHSFKTNSDNYVISGTTIIAQDSGNLLYNTNVVWDPMDTSVQTNKPYDRNLIYHDHIKEFYKTALTSNYSLSVSGATGNVDFNISAANNHQQSTFAGDGYNNRSNLVSNLGIELVPGLKLRVISQLAYTKNTVSIHNKQYFDPTGVILYMLNARPFVDFSLKDTLGNYGVNYGAAGGNPQFNPEYSFAYSTTDDRKTDILQSFELDYSRLKFFSLNIKYGLDHQTRVINFNADNQSKNNNSNASGKFEAYFNGTNTGERSTLERRNTSQNFLATGNLSFDFRDDLNLGIPLKSSTQVAFDYRSTNTHDYDTYGLGVPFNPPQTANQATTFRIARDFTTEFVTYGYRLNQRFDWGELAGISGGFRTDYSSAYGSGSKPFTFPRADAFMRISGLEAWNGWAISGPVMEWKVRAAFGKAGIQPQPFDRIPTLSTKTIGTTNSYFLGANYANPNLNVEVSTETEIGTDITFQKQGNWLNSPALSFTYWKRGTDNAITRVDGPPTSGIVSVIDNVFSLKSNGIQASFRTIVLKRNNLQWSFTTNFGKQTTKIGSIENDSQVKILDYVLKAGEKVGQLYGYIMLHDLGAIDPNTGGAFIPTDSLEFYEVASNGWVVDKRTKRPFMPTDKYLLGTPFPDFNTSFINDFTFRGYISFGFQIDWIQGGHIYNYTKSQMYREGTHSDYTKELEINGRSGAWTAFYQGVFLGRGSIEIKDYFYENGSYVRLRDAYMGLDFADLFDLRVRKLQLLLAGRNLLTWTKYTGMDPEISTLNTNGVLAQRWDHNVLPNSRTLQFTLNIGI